MFLLYEQGYFIDPKILVNKGYYMESATYAVIYSQVVSVVTSEQVSIKHKQRVNI